MRARNARKICLIIGKHFMKLVNKSNSFMILKLNRIGLLSKFVSPIHQAMKTFGQLATIQARECSIAERLQHWATLPGQRSCDTESGLEFVLVLVVEKDAILVDELHDRHLTERP